MMLLPLLEGRRLWRFPLGGSKTPVAQRRMGLVLMGEGNVAERRIVAADWL